MIAEMLKAIHSMNIQWMIRLSQLLIIRVESLTDTHIMNMMHMEEIQVWLR